MYEKWGMIDRCLFSRKSSVSSAAALAGMKVFDNYALMVQEVHNCLYF